jgi:hypothetical protein
VQKFKLKPMSWCFLEMILRHVSDDGDITRSQGLCRCRDVGSGGEASLDWAAMCIVDVNEGCERRMKGIIQDGAIVMNNGSVNQSIVCNGQYEKRLCQQVMAEANTEIRLS